MTEIPIKHLTFYNYEYDKNYPEDWTNFKDAILKSDGVLIVTPEYNRSIRAYSRMPSTLPADRGAPTPSTRSRLPFSVFRPALLVQRWRKVICVR